MDAISPACHPQKSSQHVRACATGDGAICSKNRKIVPYHGANPNTRNGARLQSPSPIMAPGLENEIVIHTIAQLWMITHPVILVIIYKQQFLHSDWLRACQLIPNQCKKVKLSAKSWSWVQKRWNWVQKGEIECKKVKLSAKRWN